MAEGVSKRPDLFASSKGVRVSEH